MNRIEELEGVNREAVKADYLGGMKLKNICSKYNLSIDTLKSWQKRYYWSAEKKASSHNELVLIHGLQAGLPYKQIVENIIQEHERKKENAEKKDVL